MQAMNSFFKTNKILNSAFSNTKIKAFESTYITGTAAKIIDNPLFETAQSLWSKYTLYEDALDLHTNTASQLGIIDNIHLHRLNTALKPITAFNDRTTVSISKSVKYLNTVSDYFNNSVPLKTLDDYDSTEEFEEYIDTKLEEIAAINDKQPISKSKLISSTVNEFKNLPLPEKVQVVAGSLAAIYTIIQIVIAICGKSACFVPLNFSPTINNYYNHTINYLPDDCSTSSSATGDSTILP